MTVLENLGIKFIYYEGLILGKLPFIFCPQRKSFIINDFLSIWSTIFCIFTIFITSVSMIFAEKLYIGFLSDADFLLSLLVFVNSVLLSLHSIVNSYQTMTRRKIILKILNKANSLRKELPTDKWKMYEKALSARIFLRYMTVMVVVILGISQPIPQAVTHMILIILFFFPFFHSLQLFYDSYALACEFIINVQQHLKILIGNDTQIDYTILKKTIHKTATSLIFVNQLKNHLGHFYSLIFLPIFATIFVSFNSNVSIWL